MPMAPAARVSGAPRQALPFGLFSHLAFRGGTERWENGTTWETLTLDGIGGLGSPDRENDGAVQGLPKTLTANGGEWGEALPFTVYGHFTCSPLGWSPADAQAQAEQHLLVREEARVEQALWTGDLGNAPALDAAFTELTSAEVGVAHAIGLLEQHIASEYGSLGMIHLSRAAATVALAEDVVEVRGTRLYTRLGTPVVAGTGYPGTGVNGEVVADGTEWILGTPPLFGYRSEVFTSSNRPGDLLDREDNDLYAVAERTYLLGFDPGVIGGALIRLAGVEETS